MSESIRPPIGFVLDEPTADDLAKFHARNLPSGFVLEQPSQVEGGFSKTAPDVLRQFGAGLVTGAESIPAFPAQALGYLGGLAEKYVPGMAPSQEQAAQREKLRSLIAEQRGQGIANYLPEPQTTAGQYARS